MRKTKKYSHAEWKAEAIKRFGTDPLKWKFICPSCGYIAAVEEWRAVQAPEGAVGVSCIGRYTGSKKTMGDKTGGPCNYTTHGLFNISPVTVQTKDGEQSAFDFAPTEEVPA